ARRGARRPARLAGGEAPDEAGASGATDYADWHSGLAFNGLARGGAGLNGYGGHHGGGHDGASAADVLGELRTLRTLLGPLVAATSHEPVLQPRAQHPPTAQHPLTAQHPPTAQPRPDRGPLGAGLLAGDDELLRLADGEEAWW
ncbi:MAG: hypothetical protein ACRDP7_34795, partial [Trebonia sp.]